MKKLYKKNSTIHPSPPLITTNLALLPATIFTLTLTLSPQDKEVLAYLISTTTTTTTTHSPHFTCNCFSCYLTFWARWDSSPNRHLIHQIIEAFEDGFVQNKKENITKKDKRKKVHRTNSTTNSNSNEEANTNKAELTRSSELNEFESVEEGGVVRKLVRFIGERIWSVWT